MTLLPMILFFGFDGKYCGWNEFYILKIDEKTYQEENALF
jgi:hypothetical protein